MIENDPIVEDILSQTEALAKEYAQVSLAPTTVRLYAKAWERFVEWCDNQELAFMPATDNTIALYLAYLASIGRGVTVIEIASASITRSHLFKGFKNPRISSMVRAVVAVIKRTVPPKYMANRYTAETKETATAMFKGNATGNNPVQFNHDPSQRAEMNSFRSSVPGLKRSQNLLTLFWTKITQLTNPQTDLGACKAINFVAQDNHCFATIVSLASTDKRRSKKSYRQQRAHRARNTTNMAIHLTAPNR